VTHDPAGARRFADAMGVLDQGKLVACGTAPELEKNENDVVRELVAIPKP
jgi:ABC-type transporter Mla maintaining outer membrane lipid asymmetry ATPase subunit MlaF